MIPRLMRGLMDSEEIAIMAGVEIVRGHDSFLRGINNM
jgi:hypothetical protein